MLVGAPRMPCTINSGALSKLSVTPGPLMNSSPLALALPILNVYAGDPGSNCSPPTCVLACRMLIVVTLDASKIAVSAAVGTASVHQLPPVFQLLELGRAFQI